MIGACDIETGSLIISVDVDELVSLIEAFRQGGPADFVLSPPASRPVFRSISHLEIRSGGERPLLVSIEGDAANVTGGKRSFRLLANELSEFHQENDLREPGMHTHFDPNEKQFNGLEISEDSIELVVTGPVPDD